MTQSCSYNAVTKLCVIFSAYGLFLKAKEYIEKIIQDVIVSWWTILLYADDTVMLI